MGDAGKVGEADQIVEGSCSLSGPHQWLRAAFAHGARNVVEHHQMVLAELLGTAVDCIEHADCRQIRSADK